MWRLDCHSIKSQLTQTHCLLTEIRPSLHERLLGRKARGAQLLVELVRHADLCAVFYSFGVEPLPKIVIKSCLSWLTFSVLQTVSAAVP